MTLSENLLEKVLVRAVRKGVLVVTRSDGTSRSFGTPVAGYPEVAIRLCDKRVARDVLTDLRLGFGEAYMDGRIAIERGDVMQLVSLMRANSRWEEGRSLAPPSMGRRIGNRIVSLTRSFNDPRRSRRNVAHHYDIGNDLYRLMLDVEHMQYSCAYWPRDGMTLGEAQEAKLAHIAAKLHLKPGNKVLDIGCGWGGMAIFLAKRAGVEVLGITLSAEQLDLARERAAQAGVADKVRFELVDYRDLAARGERFDRIVSVGMFEHVGQPQFETFFRACATMLADDGVMLLHTIGRFGTPGRTDAFTEKYVFPGGYIPALSETVAASEKVRLIATDVETLRLHYAYTIHEWYRRCMEHRHKIVALYDERFFRMWTFYLAGAATIFESGGMGNYQIQYVRNRHALPIARGYLQENEQALLTEHASSPGQ
ncbi:cyclopropane-fatty-acyl-phospholipid synthase [Tsuneonella deserti]|uniref:Cyclopropane-fatty-acyl-phospholipid synthase n=1 Tax=Tsuneonella deserti TaxID=2035528 RepID=A0ABQ1SDI3_9SPHN|nr:cyclopropane-fatty-acyl-phospholipid synthase family protein [Tsuneonella deserti]GGE02684.1 cyclopropane-fatty-acyl-phospholipid synthase [Tsuneonella deserti]